MRSRLGEHATEFLNLENVISQSDGWSGSGDNISAPETLERIRAAIEREPLILEHRFYRAARAPDRRIFDDYQKLLEYLQTRARPGDHLFLWGYSALCRDDNKLLSGKYPDAEGRTPSGGAY